jgi:hypothetical protein
MYSDEGAGAAGREVGHKTLFICPGGRRILKKKSGTRCYGTRSPLQEYTARIKIILKFPDGVWIR